MLIVLLPMAVEQNDPVAAAWHFLTLHGQSLIGETTAGFDKKALNRIPFPDSMPDTLPQTFSFNAYISRCTFNTAGIIEPSIPHKAIAHTREWLPAGFNITLVTSKIKIPLPISRLSGAVTSCMVAKYTNHSDDVRLDNLVGLPPGKETVSANHS